MDRINISFAAESMNRDLHFSAKVYGLGAGLFFLTYALCEIPSNRLLLRFGARRWMARIMLSWGLLAGAMAFVRNPASFYGVRMALGMAEAGYFPGALFLLSQWFPKGERARAVSLFYVALPLSTVVMGGLAGTLLGLGGKLGLAGWQWLFVLEAMPAILLSVVVWFALPDGPEKVSWLREDERLALMLALDTGEPATGHGGRGLVTTAFRNPMVWTFGAFMFLTLGSNYAVNFSLPIVMKQATGFSTEHAGWAIAGIGALGAVAMVVMGRHSDRTCERRWHIAVPATIMAVGLLTAGLEMQRWLAAVGLTLAAVSYYSMQGPILGLCSMVARGELGAVSIAAINMYAIAGGFVGPYWMGWMRERTGSYAAGIGWLCVPVLLAAFLIMSVMRKQE